MQITKLSKKKKRKAKVILKHYYDIRNEGNVTKCILPVTPISHAYYKMPHDIYTMFILLFKLFAQNMVLEFSKQNAKQANRTFGL